MSLTDSLKRVIGDLADSRGVAIVGMDGIVVEEQKKQADLDLHALGAEIVGLLKTADKTIDSIGAGRITELIFNAAGAMIILRRISADYLLIFAIQPDGNLGKGRFVLKRAASELKSEL